MRPLYYDESTLGPTDTITQVFDELIYKPSWFRLEPENIHVVVDIGAMIGSFTLWALEQWSKATIYAYEPDPDSYQFLVKNVNACENYDRVKTYNLAVWEKEKELQLYRFKSTPGCNSLVFRRSLYTIDKATTTKIKTCSIPNIIKEIDSHIDFLKIDCEGSEYNILYSLTKTELKKIKCIVIEYHELDTREGHTSHDLTKYLRDAGFATQLVPVNLKKNMGIGYIYAAQMGDLNNILNSTFDKETTRLVKYLELPNELNYKLNQLQKEFDKRTKWALTLDKESKEKDKVIKHFQNSFSTTESQLQETQKTLSTKEAQLQNLQGNLYMKQTELESLKNSILFKMPFKIARGLDRAFPQATKRGEALRLLRMSLLIVQNEGLGALLQEFNEKTKRRRFLKRRPFTKIKKFDFPDPSKADKISKTPNLIQGIKNNKPDPILRNFIHTDASNILKLSRFPKVSIIIPTFNQVEFLRKNLSGIEEKTTYKNYEIIVVTNNLDENSEMRKFLKTIKHQVCIFKDQYSFSEANNFAAKKTKGEFLLFLNDDVEIVSPNWLEAMLKLAMREKVGAVGSKLLLSDGKLQEAGGIIWKDGIIWNYGRNENPQDPCFNFVRNVDYCSGSCLMIKKELFEKLGEFDTQYKPAYCEDTDICLSMQKEGFKILYQPLATLIHHEGKTCGTDLKSGIKSYQIQNQKKFRMKWQQFLNSRLNDSLDNAFLERNRKEGINILYIDHYVPEYDKDAGSLLVYYMLSILSYLDHNVTFWPDNLAKNEPYITNLQQKGIEIIYGHNNFESFIKKHGNDFQICVLTRAHIAPKYIDLIRKNAPNCKIIYDTVDLHFLREYGEAKLKNDSKKIEQAERTKKVEFNLFEKSDVTIVKSKEEANVLLAENPTLQLAIIPTFDIPPTIISTYDERKDLLSLGGFQHLPNVDAIEHLITNLFPKIRDRLPNVILYVIGSNPPQNVINLCNSEKNVKFLGYVAEIEPYLQNCKLLVAPLRYGAGVKGKITQSMAYGLVVVTTQIGAEGISNNDQTILISNNDDEFIENVIRIYNNKQEWTKVSQNAKDHAEKYFSPELVKNTLEQIISFCLEK